MFAQLGKYDEALEQFEEAIRVNPSSVEAYNNAAEIWLFYQKDLDKAVAYINRALQVDPNSIDTYNNLASAFVEQGKFDKAVDKFNQSLRLDPKYHKTYDRIGMMFYAQDNFIESITNHSRAIQFDSSSALAHNNLGATLVNQWDKLEGGKANISRGITYLERARALAPHNKLIRSNLRGARLLRGLVGR